MVVLAPPRSDLFEFLSEADRLVRRYPQLLKQIDADLDLHGKNKKAFRLEDARWREARSQPLPTLELSPMTARAEQLVLEPGRPRTPAYVVYMFVVGRGYYGGFKSCEATTLLLESTTLTVFLHHQGVNMPGGSTLNELANAVSNDTREMILRAQLSDVLEERWDDFQVLIQDSTAVEGNTQWPTDSKLIVDLVGRLIRRGERLDRFGLTNFNQPRAAKVLAQLSSLHKQISLAVGVARKDRARERKKAYRAILRLARKAHGTMAPLVARARRESGMLDILPSRRDMALRLVLCLESDIRNLLQVVECCEARVVHERKVPAEDKVVSVADPSASFIVKGGRDTVVGYKPQLGRSGKGFVTGLIVPLGNAADSGQLIPMFKHVVDNTGVVPSMVSTDDGYSSEEGRDELKARGVKVVSISGSKGKRITPQDDWDDPEYVDARNGRSAVESLMFTIKQGFDFGRVMRRGLENVRAELLEKVLAYNFCRMARSRSAATEPEQRRAA
jgi:IS5 family transposase